MTTVWSEAEYPANSYARGNIAPGIGSDEISCITHKTSGLVLWRRSPGGDDWTSAPVEAITISSGPKIAHTHVLPGGAVVITNGTAVWQSKKYGKAGSWS